LRGINARCAVRGGVKDERKGVSGSRSPARGKLCGCTPLKILNRVRARRLAPRETGKWAGACGLLTRERRREGRRRGKAIAMRLLGSIRGTLRGAANTRKAAPSPGSSGTSGLGLLRKRRGGENVMEGAMCPSNNMRGRHCLC